MKSYPQQRASASGGISKPRHTLWRDQTLVRWLSVLSLFICTVCRFSLQQGQTVRGVFGNLTLVGGNSYAY